MTTKRDSWRARLQRGIVIPAHPLALNSDRHLDETRQRALSRYYLAAGAGGLAVGVHTTQFAIRDPKIGLFNRVVQMAAEEMDQYDAKGNGETVRVGGICGETRQAIHEAEQLATCGYHAGLLNLGALREAELPGLLAHCRSVGDVIPIFGFYLNPAVGGRPLPYAFWREFFEIPAVVAVKIAAFDRYRTIDVIRALAASNRDDVALYTGNDDHILLDLITPFRFIINGEVHERRIVGGLLGQWAVWTRTAVDLLEQCHLAVQAGETVPARLLALDAQLTDANAAIFDAAGGFAGCIPGIHEVLRRQGLLTGTWCLDPQETLSEGQAQQIHRVLQDYPHLTDDSFVREHRDAWFRA